MSLYYDNPLVKIYHGNCLELLPEIQGISAVVTDPPYELGFMGKEWDSRGVSFSKDTWQIIRNSCKTGAMLLSFGGTRTFHRIAVAIEDAGWELRDTIMWVYGSGFPKSLDIGKAIDKFQGNEREIVGKRDGTYADIKRDKETGQNGLHGGIATERPRVEVFETKGNSPFEGYGTALKPAYEPILVCMNPLDGTFANNALKHGVAGLNIDECRVEYQSEQDKEKAKIGFKGQILNPEVGWNQNNVDRTEFDQSKGRFPANFVHDGSQMVLDLFPDGGAHGGQGEFKQQVWFNGDKTTQNIVKSNGSAARFFYCAKASKSERNSGLDSTYTVKYNIPIGGILCKDVSMALVESLKRATSELTVTWNTGESGENITGLCLSDSLSTILMEINKITTSQILHSLMPSLINDFTQGVKSEMENGGNHVESVENLRKYQQVIMKENQELALGANLVVSQMLSTIKDAENWKPFTNSHATVKPLTLMEYLCKLVKMPEYNLILDPFVGSGTTLLACIRLGIPCIGIDSDEKACEIAAKRCEYEIGVSKWS